MAQRLFTQKAPRVISPNKVAKEELIRRFCMKNVLKAKVLKVAAFTLIVTMALPVAVSAKDKYKGRRRGRDFDRFSRKCDKFVNCHDARDGRWDGRGPDRARFEDRFNRNRRFRNRDFDGDDSRRLRRRQRTRNYRYDRSRDYGYDRYNPYTYQQNSNWTNLLNMFLP